MRLAKPTILAGAVCLALAAGLAAALAATTARPAAAPTAIPQQGPPPPRLPSATEVLVNVDPVAIYADGVDSTTIRVYAVPGLTDLFVRLLEGEDLISDALPVYDDGSHGDARAGDGVYTRSGLTLRRAFIHYEGRFTNITVEAYRSGVPFLGLGGLEDLGLIRPDARVRVRDLGDGLFATANAIILYDPGADLLPPHPAFGVDTAPTSGDCTLCARVYAKFPDAFDWLAFSSRLRTFPLWTGFNRERITVSGIGRPPQALPDPGTGSAERLQGLISFILGEPRNELVHEIFHTWVFHIDESPVVQPPHPLGDGGSHYSEESDIEDFMCCGTAARQVGGLWFEDDVDDTQAHLLTLYLAGLAAASEVPPVHRFVNGSIGPDGRFAFSDLETYSIADLQALLGSPRTPAFGDAPTDFTLALAFYTQSMPTEAEFAYFQLSAELFASEAAYDDIGQVPFFHAARGRAHVSTRLPEPLAGSATTRSVGLLPGWNLVGWTGSDPLADAAAPLAGQFRDLFTFDAAAQRFLRYNPSGSAFLNDLTTLGTGDGVWIYVTAASGTEWTQSFTTTARSASLLPGFNLVTWTGPDATPVEVAIDGLGGAFSALFTYNPATEQFRSYNPQLPAALNTAFTLNYGDALWIQVSRAVTWTQPPP